MTSANFFNGYSADKPSSKVLNPPGGQSSNIFGTAAENNRTTAIANENKARNQSSNIFFGDQGAAQSSMQQQNQGRGGQGQNTRGQSNVFNQEPLQQTQQQNRQNNNNRSGFNPITGEPYNTDNSQQQQQKQQQQYQQRQQFDRNQQYELQPQPQQQHTASRVLQPPGGKSQGLW